MPGEGQQGQVKAYKCPVHRRWMVPTLRPYPHWRCPLSYCPRKRAAKFRTGVERRIFDQLSMYGEN